MSIDVGDSMTRVLMTAGVATLILIAAGTPVRSAQSAAPAPADLRAALEGTWRLDEWHVGGQVLRPPQADGRWSNYDGVVLFTLHRAGTADSNMGWGVYEMTADAWGYRYMHMQTTSGPAGGPFTVNVAKPAAEMRWFKIQREPGKIVLLGAGDDRREYEGPFFTFLQKGQIIRKWRRVAIEGF